MRESYEFRVDGDDVVVHFDVGDGGGAAAVGPAADPAVVVAADADTVLELTAGAITPAEAIGRGAPIAGRPGRDPAHGLDPAAARHARSTRRAPGQLIALAQGQAAFSRDLIKAAVACGAPWSLRG